MFARALVGFSDTEEGRDAIELARVLANASGASLLIASVLSRRARRPPKRLAEALERLDGLGVAVDSRLIEGGSPASGLQEVAHAAHADLVVLGSSRRAAHGHGTFGTLAERLLRAAPWGIAVAPRGFAAAAEQRPEDDGDAGLRVIGAGYDASPEAEQALQLACELAVRNRAALRVFSVVPPLPEPLAGAPDRDSPPMDSPFTAHPGRELRDALHRSVSELPGEARAQAVLLRGAAAGQLVSEMEKGVDLLVMGSHGDGPLRHAMRTSLASELMQWAPRPLLVIPHGYKGHSPGA